MTNKELFGNLCMDALVRHYEKETEYLSEDASCSLSHERNMQSILGDSTKKRISGKKLALLIAAVLLTAAFIGGTVMAFQDHLTIGFTDMRDILQNKQAEKIDKPLYPSFDGLKMAEMYLGTELTALQKLVLKPKTIEIGAYGRPVTLNFSYQDEIVSVKCRYEAEFSNMDASLMEIGGRFWYRTEKNGKIQFGMMEGLVYYTVSAETEETSVSFIKEHFQ